MWWRNCIDFSSELLSKSNCQSRAPRRLCKLAFNGSSSQFSSPCSLSASVTTGTDPVSSHLSVPSAVGRSYLVSTAHLAGQYMRCYCELSKARLSMLVVATSGTGYVLGSSSGLDFAGLCWTCAGTMMVAASANSLNQVLEVKNDAKMKRTRLRPLPSGRITIPHAIAWAASVGVVGTAVLACQANVMAVCLAVVNLVIYAFIYTPLKQVHPINTWVGAIVGAIPPLLGWAASSGQLTLKAMILPAALYFWQIPHFMALAYLCRKDYAVGGYKMFSLTDTSGQRTALVAFRNCIYLFPLGLLAYDSGLTSSWFPIESSILTLAISTLACLFFRDPTMEKAKRMFYGSLLYLPLFMGGLLCHSLAGNTQLVSHAEEVQSGTAALKQKVEKRDCEHCKNESHLVFAPTRASSPVSYASIAPFPFLPAPTYLSL